MGSEADDRNQRVIFMTDILIHDAISVHSRLAAGRPSEDNLKMCFSICVQESKFGVGDSGQNYLRVRGA